MIKEEMTATQSPSPLTPLPLRGETKSKDEWQCKRCGICCRFIVIPVAEPIDLETEAYLMAHGIAHDGEKLIIPAVCQYLDMEYRKEGRNGYIYKCNIHSNKFANCRLGGEKECVDAQKAWSLLVEMKNNEKTK